MQETVFSIAGISLALRTEVPIYITENFLPFKKNNSSCCYIAQFSEVEQLAECGHPEMMVYRDQEYEVFQDETGRYIRQYCDCRNRNRPYAQVRTDVQNYKVFIEYISEGKTFLNEAGNCFWHIGWENLLLNSSRMILHASCVQTDYGGILFSGPSGIGKSTQADLWCRYQNARLLNGDRPVLEHRKKEWYAYGSPYAGSSRCYVDACCRVRCIVMLKKSAGCKLRKMNTAEAFQNIYRGLTVNSWDVYFVERITDMAIQLTEEVPVYELSCTPDVDAVTLLQKELERGNA